MRGYRGMIILLVALATVIAACGGPDKAVDLDATDWVLTSLDGGNPVKDTRITLAFEDVLPLVGALLGMVSSRDFTLRRLTRGDFRLRYSSS